MNRARLLGTSSLAVAALVAGGCVSTMKTGIGMPATTAPAKLELTPGGVASSPRSAGPAMFPVRPTKYVVSGKLADLAPTATVWRINARSVDAAAVRRFGSALGLVGTPVRTPEGWQLQDTDAVLSFMINGGDATVSYARGAPDALGGSTGSGSPGSVAPGGAVTPPSPVATAPIEVPTPAPPVDVPSASAVTTIARALLDRLGVLAGHTWSTTVSDAGAVAMSCAVGLPCPTVPPEVSSRTVTFTLALDGTRVNGTDWSVTIGAHRRLETLYGDWAAPAVIGTYALRSTAQVFAALQHGTAKFNGPQPMTGFIAPGAATPAVATSLPAGTIASVTVDITGVSLGLERWDASESGRAVVDLVPTYRFHARDDGSTYDIEVLALAPGAVAFTR